MGGDGIADKQYVKLGGRFATNIRAPAERLPSAKGFVDDYQQANYSEPSSAYGVMTYDAAKVIIDALAEVVRTGPFGDGSRKALIDAVQRTHYNGASGQVSFDKFGDTTNKLLTVYTVKGDDFVPLETGVFNGNP